MDLSGGGYDIYIMKNTFRENLDRSVDSNTAFHAVDMLFNIGDETFEDICS